MLARVLRLVALASFQRIEARACVPLILVVRLGKLVRDLVVSNRAMLRLARSGYACLGRSVLLPSRSMAAWSCRPCAVVPESPHLRMRLPCCSRRDQSHAFLNMNYTLCEVNGTVQLGTVLPTCALLLPYKPPKHRANPVRSYGARCLIGSRNDGMSAMRSNVKA